MRRAERRITGCDYGATSYTTRKQADQLTDRLELGGGTVLLDVGSGAGWPGIYLARSTGCRVVLSDLPLEGLTTAANRMAEEGVGGEIVAAAGHALPFRIHSFDAVTSSDVFC